LQHSRSSNCLTVVIGNFNLNLMQLRRLMELRIKWQEILPTVLYGAKNMNMISTGAFLTEMDASDKQDTLVSKLVTAWEKKNSKTARAGGVSLMALSLAACGSSEDTTKIYSEEQMTAAKALATSTAEDAAAATAVTVAAAAAATAVTVAAAAVTAQAAAVAAVDTTADDAAAILAAVQAVDATATTVAQVKSNATAAATPATPTKYSIGEDNLEGTSKDETFSAARIDTVETITGGDTLDGGAGTDTLTATIANNLTPVAGGITNVENLTITSVATAGKTVTFSTATVTGISGVTNITNLASAAAADLTFTRVVDLAELTMNNTAGDTTVTYNDALLTGSSDTVTLNVIGNTGALDVGNSSGGGTGIENLIINATGSASTFSAVNLDATAASVTVKGSADLDINAAAAFPKMTTFDSSASTGAVQLLMIGDTVTGATNTKTVTFGSGGDNLDLGALDPGEIGVLTVDMAGGNDTADLDNFADTSMVIKGGSGTDTLVSAAAITAANGSKITGFETFNFGANAGTQAMSNISSNVFTTLVAGAATTTFSNIDAATTTYQLSGGVSSAAATFTRLVDNATGDTATVKAVTADATLSGNLGIADEESITFDSSSFNITVSGDITSTDLTAVTLTGSNGIVLGANGTKEFSSTKIATIDASGVTGTEAVSVFAINNTVAMTVTGAASTGTFTFDGGSGIDTVTAGGGILDVDAGNGDDVLNGGAKADVLEGDGGNDTITGGEGADYIEGGAGVDTISIGGEATAASDEVELSSGAANYDNITGFAAGGGTGADNISALLATHSWNSTANTTTVLLSSAATLKAADAATDSNILTITTNVTANTFDNFVAGTITEATMEANVITALGLTGALDAAAVVLVAVDDGEDTGIFKFTSGDGGTDDAAVATEFEIMGILQGVADASTIVVGDILFT
jgi:hypothetical protein